MPVLEIITIGTELLLGEIQDTNSTYIARTLRDHGIDIYRINTIGDNTGRIASAIQEALSRADIIITTGGLGPTVDDPTRQAVAEATDCPLTYRTDLWEQIVARFEIYGHKPTENNKRQAYIPEGALPVFNPVGTAPCFIVESQESYVICLPGVPREMERILHDSIIPFLTKRFDLKSQTIKAVVLHTASMGESTIDDLIGDLEKYSNPTVGLLAHPGQTDIRVTCKAPSESEALSLIQPVIDTLEKRLGDNIYGRDEETLESVIDAKLAELGETACLLTFGLGSLPQERWGSNPNLHFKFKNMSEAPENLADLHKQVTIYRQESGARFGLGIALKADETEIKLLIAVQDPKTKLDKTRTYGGPPGYAPLWSINAGLDFLRRKLEPFL